MPPFEFIYNRTTTIDPFLINIAGATSQFHDRTQTKRKKDKVANIVTTTRCTLTPLFTSCCFFFLKITNYRPLNLNANALVLPSIFLSRLLFYLLHQCVQPFIWFYLQLICTCL